MHQQRRTRNASGAALSDRCNDDSDVTAYASRSTRVSRVRYRFAIEAVIGYIYMAMLKTIKSQRDNCA